MRLQDLPPTLSIPQALSTISTPVRGWRFLDVAAGSGPVAILAARRGAHVVAVDIAPAMIERLVAQARSGGLSNVEGHIMDGTALDLEEASFDVAA